MILNMITKSLRPKLLDVIYNSTPVKIVLIKISVLKV